MTYTYPREEIIKEIECIVKNFLETKKVNIPYKILINNKKNGGIGLVDVACKAKTLSAKWYIRLLNRNCTKNHSRLLV